MKKQLRLKKHNRIRRTVIGSAKRPRLSVFRSLQHIYAQLIDDDKGVTLMAESDTKGVKGKKADRAYEVGKKLAEKAIKSQIDAVVFDRGGFLYRGRIAQLAKGARDGGLKF